VNLISSKIKLKSS